jgi:hypothetical protein
VRHSRNHDITCAAFTVSAIAIQGFVYFEYLYYNL